MKLKILKKTITIFTNHNSIYNDRKEIQLYIEYDNENS